MTAVARLLPDSRRLHLQHGPIDMIVKAWGAPEAVAAAYRAAAGRFDGLLEELAAELPALRSASGDPLHGPVARAMEAAVRPFRPDFITPMAAVAGAGAEAILAALVATGGVTRAYVNNGGDIALHLAPGERLTAAVAARAGMPDHVTVTADSPVRGIATSGWRGRSWSFGIADAVTVLAPTAAMADAAATMIANAVDLGDHPAITRRPASALQAEIDLGDRPVTVAVAPLSRGDIACALDRGLAAAEGYRARGLIVAAALFLAGEVRTCGPLPALAPEPALA